MSGIDINETTFKRAIGQAGLTEQSATEALSKFKQANTPQERLTLYRAITKSTGGYQTKDQTPKNTK